MTGTTPTHTPSRGRPLTEAPVAAAISRRPSAPVLLLLLAAVILAAYFPVFTHDFVQWDDTYHLLNNPRMNPPRLSAVGSYWARPFFGMYIPVTYTCWTAVGVLAWVPDGRGGFELNPYVFHAANLAIHLLAAGAAWLLLARLTRDRLAATVGAAIFAVHPTTVEAVAWVSGFRDVLGGLLSLAAIYCYVRAEDPDPAGSPRRRSWYAGGTLLFAAAILAKPASVSAAIAAGAIAVFLLRRTVRRTALLLLPWALIAAAAALATSSIQKPPGPRDLPPPLQRVLVAGDATAFYLGKLVLPTNLCVHYGRTPSWVLDHSVAWKTSLVTLAVAAAVVAVGLRRRDRRWVLAAGAVFVAGILPTVGLVPFTYQNFSTVADRYLYLGLLGPALAVAYLLAGRRAPTAAIATAALVVVPLAVLTHVQARTWHSSETLFAHAIEVNPGSNVALNGLAYVRLQQDDPAAAERLARRSVEVSGGDPRALTALAISLIRQGRWREAQPCYAQAAINGFPADAAKALAGLGDLRAEHGTAAEATAFYRRALELDPAQPQARAGLDRLAQRPPAVAP